MALKRLLKKSVFGGGSLIRGHIYDAIDKKRKTGKSFKECLQESINETIQEDMPVASHIYQQGKHDGKIDGIAEQAQRDEKKIKNIQDEHQKDREEWRKLKNDYEDLLDDLDS